MFDIKISSEILASLLKPLKKVTSAKDPILDKVQMEITSKDSPLTLRSTDLDYYLILSSPCAVGGLGKITIPRNSFVKILSSIKKDTQIRLTEQSGSKIFIQYDKAKFNINGYREDSFPCFSFVKDYDFQNFVNAPRFIKTLTSASKVIPDTDIQISGYRVASCRFDFFNMGVSISATDGHRYSYSELTDEGIQVGEGEKRTLSLSEKGIEILIEAFRCFNERYEKSLEKIYFFIEPNRIIFKIGEQILIIPTLTKDIPGASEVFALDKAFVVKFDRRDFLSTLKQVVAVLAYNEQDLQLGFHGGELFFRCKSKVAGQSLATIAPTELIKIKTEQDLRDWDVLQNCSLTKWINGHYLVQAIASFDSEFINLEWEATDTAKYKTIDKKLFIKNLTEDFYQAIAIAGISRA